MAFRVIYWSLTYPVSPQSFSHKQRRLKRLAPLLPFRKSFRSPVSSPGTAGIGRLNGLETHASSPPGALILSAQQEEKIMRELRLNELAFVSGAGKANFGGGPGNSGPGDKNSQNERGKGGQPTDR
jgi:hypothetical protein